MHQLYKVFRIDGDYALSHLLLSHKDDESSGRMLIGIEVSSAGQYDAAVRPFFPTHSDGGVLKFTVSDIQRRKEPVNSATSNRASFANDEPMPMQSEVVMHTDGEDHERLPRAHTFHALNHRHGSRHHHDRMPHHVSHGTHRNEESRRRSVGSFPPTSSVPPPFFPLRIPGAFPALPGPWNSSDRPLPPPPVGNLPHHHGRPWGHQFAHPFFGPPPPPPPPPPAPQQEMHDPEKSQDTEMNIAPQPPLHAAVSNASLFSTTSSTSTASSVKEDVKSLIDGFVANLNATLARNGISELTLVDAARPPDAMASAFEPEVAPEQVTETTPNVSHPGIICDHCNKPVQGIRYKVSSATLPAQLLRTKVDSYVLNALPHSSARTAQILIYAMSA